MAHVVSRMFVPKQVTIKSQLNSTMNIFLIHPLMLPLVHLLVMQKNSPYIVSKQKDLKLIGSIHLLLMSMVHVDVLMLVSLHQVVQKKHVLYKKSAMIAMQ